MHEGLAIQRHPQTDVAESIDAFKDKGLELIVDYAGFGTTTAAAIETLAEFGTLVQVGMGRLEATINTYPLIIKQLSIKGSKSGTSRTSKPSTT
jgi:propanol-preferring alcohol dehydrogenase